MWAFIDVNPDKIAQFGMNLLAIFGGFLVGKILSSMAIASLDRWIWGGRTPQPMKDAWSTIGGLIVGLLVAIILFGHGVGWTVFGGGGIEDTNAPDDTGTQPTEITDELPTPPPPPEPVAEGKDQIRVTVLGGTDVRDQKFYQIDAEATPVSLADLEASIISRTAKDDSLLGIEVRFAPRYRLPNDHPAVQRLSRLATAHGLDITFPAD